MRVDRIHLTCPACGQRIPVDLEVSLSSKVRETAGFFDDSPPVVSMHLDVKPDLSEVYAHVWGHEEK